MKIVCFTESLAAGGAQRHLVNLAVLFAHNGHEVNFLVYREENFFLSLLLEANIPVHYAKNSNKLIRLLSVRKYIRKFNADIVLSFLETPNLISCFSAIGGYKWKVITTELSAKESTFNGRRSSIYLFFLQRFADWIVCNSMNAERMWNKYCPHLAYKTSTIYNPVLLPQGLDSDSALPKTKRRIVVPASYQFIKNPIRLIEAVRRLPKQVINKLQIDWYGKIEPTKGNTVAYDQASELVKHYGLEDVITLYTETTDIYNIMISSDAIGLFSTVEGLPNAVCEGMMMGKPIIMSMVSDYQVFAKESGIFLCDAENVDSIRETLISFLETSEKDLREMGNRNRIMAERLFSGDVIVKQWEKLFQQLHVSSNKVMVSSSCL